MGSTSTTTAFSHAEKAIKVLHGYILNPPTSIAKAILPSRMADRLSLASLVFNLELFLEARKQDRPELALISAALPVPYMQAGILADAASAAPEESSTTSVKPEHALEITHPRSKIDIARGIAEIPPAKALSIQVVFCDEPGISATDCALPEESLVIGFATKAWAGIHSFRGLL